MPANPSPRDILDVIVSISIGLDDAGIDFAIGGAFALSYWGTPRATVDVDVTIYLPGSDVPRVIDVLNGLGCEFDEVVTANSFVEHSFARIQLNEVDVDVFLPMISFYEAARLRRKQVSINEHVTYIWDAETLCVFKMMFFRLKDLADVEDILRIQSEQLDRQWVGRQIKSIYGIRDPRFARWQELSGLSS